MKQKLLFVLTGLVFSGVVALSQNTIVLVNKTNTAIAIDGVVDEVWKSQLQRFLPVYIM